MKRRPPSYLAIALVALALVLVTLAADVKTRISGLITNLIALGF